MFKHLIGDMPCPLLVLLPVLPLIIKLCLPCVPGTQRRCLLQPKLLLFLLALGISTNLSPDIQACNSPWEQRSYVPLGTT